jgi:LytR cell envelope-related transcriptional attenuator
MTNKGKHSSSSNPGTFYRDLAIMILGIILVGAAVFFLLYLFADEPDTGPIVTTTTVATTTTQPGDTSTTGGGATTTTPGSTSTSASVDVRPPAEVAVVVLNSIGVDGAAGRLTSDLAQAGYQTLTPDNFEPEQDPSQIWYREGFAAEAAALVELIPGASVEPIPDETLQEGADVVIVLGVGFTE